MQGRLVHRGARAALMMRAALLRALPSMQAQGGHGDINRSVALDQVWAARYSNHNITTVPVYCYFQSQHLRHQYQACAALHCERSWQAHNGGALCLPTALLGACAITLPVPPTHPAGQAHRAGGAPAEDGETGAGGCEGTQAYKWSGWGVCIGGGAA